MAQSLRRGQNNTLMAHGQHCCCKWGMQRRHGRCTRQVLHMKNEPACDCVAACLNAACYRHSANNMQHSSAPCQARTPLRCLCGFVTVFRAASRCAFITCNCICRVHAQQHVRNECRASQHESVGHIMNGESGVESMRAKHMGCGLLDLSCTLNPNHSPNRVLFSTPISRCAQLYCATRMRQSSIHV